MVNDQYIERSRVLIGIIVVLAVVYIVQLLRVQILNVEYQISAENNSTLTEIRYPARGLVYDRHGELLVANAPAYDLMVIPGQLAPFDTAQLSTMLDISQEQLAQRLEKARRYSYYKPSAIVKQMRAETYARLQEYLYKYPGFHARARTQRVYPQNISPHVLGDVGEVGQQLIDTSDYYKMGDYIGNTGIEKSYEEILRGRKGQEIFLVDVHGQKQGPYKDGRFDAMPQAGKDIRVSLDAELQAYGEKLMENKLGSIVAIEPGSGEILSLVSSPSYNPNLLVGRQRGKNFTALSQDTLNPLFNRALMAMYPPGSIFKLVNALVGLETGAISPQSRYACRHGYHVGSFHLGCHHNEVMQLRRAIQMSCNAYFCNVFRNTIDHQQFEDVREGYSTWRDYVMEFGLGRKIETDLRNQLKGILPTADYFDRFYGKGRWRSLMLVSMAIGQGELSFTPLQNANMAAAIANRGFYYPPHVIKAIEGNTQIPERFRKPKHLSIDTAHFVPVIEGMQKVVEAGTATTARIDSIVVCGKTGTAENPHGEDHSIFVAFAPKDDPQIAISVYVENAGFGSVWAAPIASMMIEKYLKGKIGRNKRWWEKRILDANLIQATNPTNP